MPEQLDLFTRVDPDSGAYRRGFCAGFVARPDADPPATLTGDERVGWLDGRDHVQVPEHRWTDQPVT